ncbi:MAG: fumarylacetoacetate hydrolase family protein [Pseudomonadota bacterium]
MLSYEEMAVQLRTAYGGATIEPLRQGLASDDIDGAYAVQEINTRYWVENGRTAIGRKIGLTSTAVQKQLGVEQPDFGVLFEDMRIEDGGTILAGRLAQPKAEAEIALVLGRDLLSERCTADEVANAVEYAICAIEIVDSRISDWRISFADTVADNGSSGMFVLGSDHVPLNDLDLYSCGMVMERNGEIVSLGAGAACLGHPLNATAWLARTSVQFGQPLRSGDIILTGALGPMVALQPGDHFKAIVGGIGRCSFRYEA